MRVYERNLPHWRQEGGTYFVTFRLADSLPASVAEDVLREAVSACYDIRIDDDLLRRGAGELAEMRAFMVEFAGADDTAARGILEGRALELSTGRAVAMGDGSLAPAVAPNVTTTAEGEPL